MIIVNYENCSDLLQQENKVVDVEFKYKKVSQVLTVNYPSMVNISEFNNSEEWIESYKCIVPVLMINKAATYSPFLKDSATTSTVYDRGKQTNMEKLMDNELLVRLRTFWAPWASIELLRNIWSSHLTVTIDRIYGEVFDRGKLLL